MADVKQEPRALGEALAEVALSEPAIDAALAAFYSQYKYKFAFGGTPARREDMRRAIAAALNKGAP